MRDPIQRKSLAETAAGKLAAQLLDGTFKPGGKLPSERDLIDRFAISRSTLREALKILAENELIESRPGVGWFACTLDKDAEIRAHELSASRGEPQRAHIQLDEDTTPLGPKRLPTGPEKPLQVPNLKTDRLGTFDLISWWDREKVQDARVLVVGAGALGNEVVKNLALMGVGYVYVIDFDEVEAANLSRSVLFRESDSGRQKARVAAARAREINPDIHIQYAHGDVTTQLGLGVVRRMDVVIGCLDNREARLAVNRFAYWMDRPWVDGAIQELLGLVRTFVPGEGACFECTLTEQARRDLALRYSCPLLARANVLLGKVPTTPTIASIIGAMQCQEALKLIHGMPVEAGKVTHFNGMTNDMHTASYSVREECESHWTYGDVTELSMRADSTSAAELLRVVHADLGPDSVLELDQELVLSLRCPSCGLEESLVQPIADVSFEAAHCPNCGVLRETDLTHTLNGSEPFLDRSLASLGVPPLHILRAYNAEEFRFYELTGDLADALHFSHFTGEEKEEGSGLRDRIRLGPEVKVRLRVNAASGKIRLQGEDGGDRED